MAKEEQTIGISRGLSITIMLVIGVIAAMAFWFDRGGTEAKAESIHNSIVASHETRITANSNEIKVVKTNQHLAELARTEMDGKLNLMVQAQQAMDVTQKEMNKKQDKFIEYLMQYDYDKKKDTD